MFWSEVSAAGKCVQGQGASKNCRRWRSAFLWSCEEFGRGVSDSPVSKVHLNWTAWNMEADGVSGGVGNVLFFGFALSFYCEEPVLHTQMQLIPSLVCHWHLTFQFKSLNTRKCGSKTHKQLHWPWPVQGIWLAAPGRCPQQALANVVLSPVIDIIGPCVLVWRTSGMEKLLRLRNVSDRHNLMWSFHQEVSGWVGHKALLLAGKRGLISSTICPSTCAVLGALGGRQEFISVFLVPAQTIFSWLLFHTLDVSSPGNLMQPKKKKKKKLRT